MGDVRSLVLAPLPDVGDQAWFARQPRHKQRRQWGRVGQQGASLQPPGPPKRHPRGRLLGRHACSTTVCSAAAKKLGRQRLGGGTGAAGRRGGRCRRRRQQHRCALPPLPAHPCALGGGAYCLGLQTAVWQQQQRMHEPRSRKPARTHASAASQHGRAHTAAPPGTSHPATPQPRLQAPRLCQQAVTYRAR